VSCRIWKGFCSRYLIHRDGTWWNNITLYLRARNDCKDSISDSYKQSVSSPGSPQVMLRVGCGGEEPCAVHTTGISLCYGGSALRKLDQLWAGSDQAPGACWAAAAPSAEPAASVRMDLEPLPARSQRESFSAAWQGR